ncbi:MAG: TlpA disulfide reductase family protein [SAR324 cluster bacterium]|nr:TlpA disulfide reductase family protein [SAR324 cluster bacterium]
MKALLFLAVAALLLVPAHTAAHAPQRHGFDLVIFKRPLPAPDFKLISPSGKPVRLSDFKGKTVLLNFWATWCPPCVREMPSMEALYKKYKQRNFAVLAISLDEGGATAVKPFIEKLALTFPIALDPENKVSKVYGARDLPSSFILDAKGQVIAAAKGEREWFSPDAVSYMEELLAQQAQTVTDRK